MEHKGLFAVVVVLAVAVLLVPVLVSKWNHTAEPSPVPAPSPVPVAAPEPLPSPATAAVEAPPAKLVLDAAILGKLLYGMSYEQVVAVVGAEADETETQYDRDKTGYTGPMLTIWKTWINPDGSKLRVGFVESKLEQKQFKLKERNSRTDGTSDKR